MSGFEPQEQFIHLVRLAWDLRALGVSAMVDLRCDMEPAVVIPSASDRLKITAIRRGRTWLFTWGRGREQCVRAYAKYAAERIAGVVATW